MQQNDFVLIIGAFFTLIGFISPSSLGTQAPANDISCHRELPAHNWGIICKRAWRDNFVRGSVGYYYGTLFPSYDVHQFETNGKVERL